MTLSLLRARLAADVFVHELTQEETARIAAELGQLRDHFYHAHNHAQTHGNYGAALALVLAAYALNRASLPYVSLTTGIEARAALEKLAAILRN